MADMLYSRDDLLAFLDRHGIAYDRYDHPPLATVADVHRHIPHLPGEKTKNLFLRDKPGKRHFLVTAAADQHVDLKALATVLGVSRISFGSEKRLKRLLGIAPGSVSLLALIHDRDGQVEAVVDQILWQATALHCHPLINTSTVVMRPNHLEQFFECINHTVRIVHLPRPELRG